MPCKKKMKTDYYPKAFGLLGYKQTWGRNDSEKFQTITSLEGNKAVQ